MMLDSSDINIDQAILEHRIAAAQEFARACAVDPRGRRDVSAREVRCRRAAPVPAANDDERPSTAFKGRRFTVDPDDPMNVIVRPLLDTRRHFRGDPDVA